MTFRTGVASTLLVTAAILAPAAPVAAQVTATGSYDLPAQDLETSLRAVARTSGHQIIIASSAVEGRTAPALTGQYSAEQAVRALLAGTNIRVRVTPEAILVGGAGPVAATDQATNDGDAITVTGSRIKGAQLASPQITISREEIARAGFGDMGEALRSLPQNFGGGQNPGVGIGAIGGGLTNRNVTGGSAVNLRGLGPDATLTLLNGHRLSFGGLAQGVDISALPTDVIERVEIVPDGASALYGSDAVAGVVNVILRRSLDGLSLRTRLGTATDGGGFSQQYQAVLGQQWSGGRILLGYSYRRDSKIEATDRSYTYSLGEPYPLVPGQSNHSLVLSGTQEIAGGGEFSIDATFNKRKSSKDYFTYGVLQLSGLDDKTFTVAPTLALPLGSSWRLTTTGVYSETKTNVEASQYLGTVLLGSDSGCYCHSLFGLEAFLEGPVVSMPRGTVRAVFGGGYRSNKYVSVSPTSRRGGTEKDRYIFGELSVPLISPANEISWARSVMLTGAARYDNYELAGDVVTPRIGLVYSPSSDVDFKFSWGRSFKAPSLAQQFSPRSASLSPVRSFGVNTAPAGATGLALSGGSPDLRPERATTQSWTADWHPAAVAGLNAEISYFRVKYTDRVLAPIGNYRDSLNSAYAAVVIANPTPEQINAALDGSTLFINNVGTPLDPANVMYLINNRYRNVAAQKIQGVDVNISYRVPAAGGEMSVSVGGSWLDSEQKNGPRTEYFGLSGAAWQPARLRARGSLGWGRGGTELYAFLNYIGGVEDRRARPYQDGSAMITADLSVSYTLSSGNRWLNGLKAQIVFNNILDQKPPYLLPAAFAEPYDSTNYSAVGRFVAFSLSHSL